MQVEDKLKMALTNLVKADRQYTEAHNELARAVVNDEPVSSRMTIQMALRGSEREEALRMAEDCLSE